MLLEKSNTQSEENQSPELFSTEKNSLLFTDDLAIFSLIKNELQEKRDSLGKNSKQWDLNLNLKKTKVIIFNKQGNTTKKNYFREKFYYRENKLKLQANVPTQVYICNIREKICWH